MEYSTVLSLCEAFSHKKRKKHIRKQKIATTSQNTVVYSWFKIYSFWNKFTDKLIFSSEIPSIVTHTIHSTSPNSSNELEVIEYSNFQSTLQ